MSLMEQMQKAKERATKKTKKKAPLKEAWSITICESGENHTGMEILGEKADEGMSIELLKEAKTKAEADGYTCEYFNLKELGFESISKVHQSRVEKKIPALMGPYDLITMDPPYSYPKTIEILESLAHSLILNTGGILVLEHSNPLGFPQTLGNLCLLRCAKYGETSLKVYIRE